MDATPVEPAKLPTFHLWHRSALSAHRGYDESYTQCHCCPRSLLDDPLNTVLAVDHPALVAEVGNDGPIVVVSFAF